MSTLNPTLTPQVNTIFGTVNGANYWTIPGGASLPGSNLTLLATTPVQLIAISAGNINAAARYVKIYDVAALAQTSIAGVPSAQTFIIPGNTAGGGTNIVSAAGTPFAAMQLQHGLAVGLFEGPFDTAQSGVASGDCVLNVWYR